MGRRWDQAVRVVVIVERAVDVPAPRPDAVVLVLDPAWTPLPDGRPDVLAARQSFGAIVERRDLFDEALEHIDGWADRSRAADRIMVEGVTYWFRMREPMWRWLHERLLWRYVLASIGGGEPALVYRMPADQQALRDVAVRVGTVELEPGVDAPVEDPAVRPAAGPAPTLVKRIVRRLRRLLAAPSHAASAATSGVAPTARDPLAAALAERIERLVETDEPRVVVLTTPATHQRVGSAEDRRDPILGSVVDRLGEAGLKPVLMAIGTDHRREEDRALLAADERMVPGSMLASRWGRPEDRARADRAVSSMEAAVEGLRDVRLEIDGVDLTVAFVDALRDRLVHVVRNDVLQRARVERFLAELEPSAVLLAQEGIRVPWLVAARDAGVPLFAVQHGILYPGHPGYPHQRHPAAPRASTTFVYGPYEREMLLERGAYLPAEVEVSGSPRFDLDGSGIGAALGEDMSATSERAAVRSELGVADEDRLLVVSTVNLPLLQRAHLAPMLERVLGGALLRVHVVFKLHPGERDEGPYRALLEGLARARGYSPPPISVVRDIDLYRLLRAADAHLGLHSTVLTEAVAAGTPNLIATVDAHADILGYVEAGVARPVGGVHDVMDAMETPAAVDPAARAAFLARHFLEGDAGVRIVRSIRDAVTPGDPVSSTT